MNGIVGFEPILPRLYVKAGTKVAKEKPPAGEATAGGQFLAIRFFASFSGEAVIWLCFRAGVAFLLVRAWLQKKEPII